ncbi:uncharacterized protein B0H64DRAFT_28747 [Chaetomium fimeti]|uniref:Uncharacterized protein n=1 Tax=Chaetomium fimeti TaxID=1854472 RepID=A0AAE0LXA5_9PEZI|nr:hypothetical protein B0H64DRAFT_28747 [Chaetomium fimeti]
MKFQAFGIVCLISGALAAPLEQAQNSQQVQPHQVGAAAAPAELTPEGLDPEMMMAGHEQMQRPNHMEPTSVDMDAFQEMVSQVQNQVAAIDQLVEEQGADPEALMEALVNPMAELDQTLAMGVSRLALPGLGGLGGLLGAVGGGTTTKKTKPLTLVSELLAAVSKLLEGLLTKGPIGNLLNDLLGGILGGVTGTVGGVLGGGAAGEVPDLLESILSSVGAVAGGLPVAVPKLP